MRGFGVKRAALWVALVVTVISAYFAVRDVRFAEVAAGLKRSDYIWVAPSLVVFALSIFLRAVRWRFLFVRDRRPSLRAVTAASLVGYLFNNILPLRAGEAARVVVLKQRARTPTVESAGTVVVERAYDVLSLLVLLFVALPWLPPVTWVRAAALLGLAVGTAMAGAILVLAVYGDRPIRFLLKPLARLPFVSPERAEIAVVSLHEGLSAIRRPHLALAAFFWTTLSWIVMALSFWLLMLGFDLDLSPVAGLFVLIAIGLSMILPSSPAAVGVFEAATVAALSAYAVPDSVALSYALVLHALNFAFFVGAGALALRTASPGTWTRLHVLDPRPRARPSASD